MSVQYTIGLDNGSNPVRTLIFNGTNGVKITFQQVVTAAKKSRLNFKRP